MCLKLGKRVDLKHSHKKKKKKNKRKGNCEILDVLIHLTMGLISQCIHTSDHHM